VAGWLGPCPTILGLLHSASGNQNRKPSFKRLPINFETSTQCWDAVKYRRGVDARSASELERASEREEEADENGKLDLDLITSSINSQFFNRYIVFAIKSDEIADKDLAAWGENCICHGPMFQATSDYMKRKVLQSHYGDGNATCPMAGKLAPEIVDGHLSNLIKKLWAQTEHDLLRGSSAELHPLTEEDIEDFKQEISRAKATSFTLFQAKQDYMFRLPNLLIGLAVLDEDRARAIGQRAVDQFERDPRPPPVHDEITWELMQPQAVFRQQLNRFLDGESRWLLTDQI
jgi:hypothetical protein